MDACFFFVCFFHVKSNGDGEQGVRMQPPNRLRMSTGMSQVTLRQVKMDDRMHMQMSLM